MTKELGSHFVVVVGTDQKVHGSDEKSGSSPQEVHRKWAEAYPGALQEITRV